MKRTRFVLALALVGAMAAIATAPLSPAGAAPDPLAWVGSNPLVSLAYAQGGQEPVTPEPEAVEEPVQGPPEPEAVEEPVQGPPEPEVVEEPQPEQAEDAEPEPAPEPTLGDFWATLQGAITAEAANSVTVGAASDALALAFQALADAEQAHAAAMEGQVEHDADIRTAAQALVGFVTASYLE